VSAELRARVSAAAAAEESPTRAAVNRGHRLKGMVAAASGIGAFVVFAGRVSEGDLARLGGELTSHQYLERRGEIVWKTTPPLARRCPRGSGAEWTDLQSVG